MEAVNVHWEWQGHWFAAAGMVLVLVWYGRGLRHVARESETIRPPLFGLGLALLALAWLSPLADLATQLFSLRVVQRILLIGLVPFLVMLSNPAPVLFAGLPSRAQRRLRAWPHNRPLLWQFWLGMSKPSFAWIFFVCTVWLWYDETLHAYTLANPGLHQVEMGLLLAAALFYWWHILAMPPHLHAPMHPVLRILYAVIGSGPVKFVGLVLLFSTETIYNYPASLQFDGLDITDQSLAGLLIWTLGGIVYTWTAVYLTREWMGLEADKPALPHSAWATDEAMRAPGFGKRSTPPPGMGWQPKDVPLD